MVIILVPLPFLVAANRHSETKSPLRYQPNFPCQFQLWFGLAQAYEIFPNSLIDVFQHSRPQRNSPYALQQRLFSEIDLVATGRPLYDAAGIQRNSSNRMMRPCSPALSRRTGTTLEGSRAGQSH
jgi:hypothetical protein